MPVIRILQYPDPRLRAQAVQVKDVKSPKIQQIIDDMFETLYHTPNCAGLSATQLDLDVDVPPRITVIDDSVTDDKPLCLVNPVITHKEGKSSYREGCMSVYPDHIHAEVERADKITFTALDRDGNPMEVAAQGFFAICVQHEIDHLDGVLYIDHLSPFKYRRIEKRITKVRRQLEG